MSLLHYLNHSIIHNNNIVDISKLCILIWYLLIVTLFGYGISIFHLIIIVIIMIHQMQ